MFENRVQHQKYIEGFGEVRGLLMQYQVSLVRQFSGGLANRRVNYLCTFCFVEQVRHLELSSFPLVTELFFYGLFHRGT
jgi:hypothetical protein